MNLWGYMVGSRKQKKAISQQEQNKVEEYQEETFYILQKLKQLKHFGGQLDTQKDKRLSNYIEKRFSKERLYLLYLDKNLLRRLAIIRTGGKRTPLNSTILKRSNIGHSEFFSDFRDRLEQTRAKSQEEDITELKKELRGLFKSEEEWLKEMKSKVDLEEEILILKTKVSVLEQELSLEQKTRTEDQIKFEADIQKLKRENSKLKEKLKEFNAKGLYLQTDAMNQDVDKIRADFDPEKSKRSFVFFNSKIKNNLIAFLDLPELMISLKLSKKIRDSVKISKSFLNQFVFCLHKRGMFYKMMHQESFEFRYNNIKSKYLKAPMMDKFLRRFLVYDYQIQNVRHLSMIQEIPFGFYLLIWKMLES